MDTGAKKINTDFGKKALELLSRIPDFSEADLRFKFDYTTDDCMPFVIAEGIAYTYYLYERGQCSERMVTYNEDVALYWVFDSYVFDYSVRYEASNRIRYTDARRLMFETQRKLFSYIGEPYLSMYEKEESELLKTHPYDDTNSCCIDLTYDFERIAKILRKLSETGSMYSLKCNKSIDYFVNMDYRVPLHSFQKNEYGGISNFEEEFKKMLCEFGIIANELSKEKFPSNFNKIIDEIREIEKENVSSGVSLETNNIDTINCN